MEGKKSAIARFALNEAIKRNERGEKRYGLRELSNGVQAAKQQRSAVPAFIFREQILY